MYNIPSYTPHEPMGQTASVQTAASTFSQNVQDSINQQVSNVIQSTSSAVNNNQLIKIGSINCTSGAGFGAISQTMLSTVNVSAALKALDQSKMQQIVNNAINQALQEDQSSSNQFLAFGGGTDSNNTTYQNNVNKLYNSFDYNTFATTLQNTSNSQTIDINEINGLCNFGNGFSQYMQTSVAVKAAVDKITDAYTSIATDAKQQQQLQSTQSNVSTGLIGDIGNAVSGTIGSLTSLPLKIVLIFVGVIIGIILLVIGIKKLGHSTTEGTPAPVTMSAPTPATETTTQ